MTSLPSVQMDPKPLDTFGSDLGGLGGGAPLQDVGCLLETLASRRAAGTGHEDPQPDINASQLWFAVKRGVV